MSYHESPVFNHQLWLTVVHSIAPEWEADVTRVVDAAGRDAPFPTNRLTPKNSRTWRVFKRVGDILERIGRLHEAVGLLRLDPSDELLKRARFDGRGSWLSYHYTTYLITLASVSESALALTNELLELGIPDREVCTESVATSPRARASGAMECIESLERLVRKSRADRNSYLHRGRSPEISQVSGNDDFSFLEYGEMLNTQAQLPDLSKDLRRAFGIEADRIGARLDSEIGEVESRVANLFDCLCKQYEPCRRTC